MKTEKELKEGCGKWDAYTSNNLLSCQKGNLCKECEANLKTLQERNAEIKQVRDLVLIEDGLTMKVLIS